MEAPEVFTQLVLQDHKLAHLQNQWKIVDINERLSKIEQLEFELLFSRRKWSFEFLKSLSWTIAIMHQGGNLGFGMIRFLYDPYIYNFCWDEQKEEQNNVSHRAKAVVKPDELFQKIQMSFLFGHTFDKRFDDVSFIGMWDKWYAPLFSPDISASIVWFVFLKL